jgi:hypothetical protein
MPAEADVPFLTSVEGTAVAGEASPDTAGRKAAIGHRSAALSARPLPFNGTPRAMRSRWVNGSTSPKTCAQTDIPRNETMKPKSRSDGKKKKNVICMACNWLFASVEKV